MKLTKRDVDLAKADDIWTLGNETLYKLCRDYPEHKTDKAIAAKIWLIGRAYAAAVEAEK